MSTLKPTAIRDPVMCRSPRFACFPARTLPSAGVVRGINTLGYIGVYRRYVYARLHRRNPKDHNLTLIYDALALHVFLQGHS